MKVNEPDSREIEGFYWPAQLSKVSVTSKSLPSREVMVLRLESGNEEFARLALEEGWSPK